MRKNWPRPTVLSHSVRRKRHAQLRTIVCYPYATPQGVEPRLIPPIAGDVEPCRMVHTRPSESGKRPAGRSLNQGTSGVRNGGGQRADVERYGRDAVEAVGFPQGEQVLGLRCDRVHGRCGHRLPPVDAVVVAERADRYPLRGEGGPHGLGERGVKVVREATYLLHRGPLGLCLPELALRFAGYVEKVRSPRGEG